jgi:hypothetical protein
MVESLPSKHEALNSNPSTAKKKKRKLSQEKLMPLHEFTSWLTVKLAVEPKQFCFRVLLLTTTLCTIINFI